MNLTPTGERRARYAQAFRTVDPRPSRFSNQGSNYRAWAQRADAWQTLAEHRTKAAASSAETVTYLAEVWPTLGGPITDTPVSGDMLAVATKLGTAAAWDRAALVPAAPAIATAAHRIEVQAT